MTRIYPRLWSKGPACTPLPLRANPARHLAANASFRSSFTWLMGDDRMYGWGNCYTYQRARYYTAPAVYIICSLRTVYLLYTNEIYDIFRINSYKIAYKPCRIHAMYTVAIAT